MKFNWKLSKDKWLLMLLFGVVLLIIAIPTNTTKKEETKNPAVSAIESAKNVESSDKTYEEQLEVRVRQILKNVEGVGTVDVMIVLKSTQEKVLRVDKNSNSSNTTEKDSTGGTRDIINNEQQENTILAGGGSENAPIVEKELMPEIEGIIISAAGGGSPVIKAEISEAMVALFNIPSHKIKVLKRVE